MPAGDGTGPGGVGSMTGRGMGYCNGFDRPGYMNRPGHHLYGRGYGFNRGRGRGFRRPGYPTNTQFQQSPDEVEFLRNRAGQLEDELKAIHNRLDELVDGKENEDN